MAYCLDSCALIDLGERHYPEHVPVFAPIWDHLYQAIADGTAISVDSVRSEMEDRAGDWRKAFLLKCPSMFHISEELEKEYAQVISDIENNPAFAINKHRERFMAGADPWLIAQARLTGCKVVSSEIKNFTNYGMKYVSAALGVECLNLVEFFQAAKIGS